MISRFEGDPFSSSAMRVLPACVPASALLCGCVVNVGVEGKETACPAQAATGGGTASAATIDPAGWRQAEKGILEDHVQLTFPDRFVKAGEAYFSPDETRIIFQAIEVPPQGAAADEFYAMFIADVATSSRGRLTGIDNIRRISPPGSFNTCGWFHPTEPDVVIFASTMSAPSTVSPGYQRGGRSYRWQFPREMNIYRCDLSTVGEIGGSLQPLVVNEDAYLAECSLTSDGRHLLYTSLESNEGDLFIRDLLEGTTARVVGAHGYDGGPFFSPDDRRICYRSDRRGDDLLQIFVGDLAFNDAGSAVGLKHEYQLTDNRHVNFAPYWHPSGRYLAYCTSEMGHDNYEVFLVDADPGDLPGSAGTIKYGTAKRRITHAAGFDGFPTFNRDGARMLWTSQRDGSGTSQVWVAEFMMRFEPEREADEPRPASD
jgi:hypothetical protein